MAVARDGSAYIIDAMITKLLSDFSHTRVNGLDSNPIFTDTVTPRTPEPYVYIYEEDSEEAWVTKENESREYHITAQIMVRNEVGRGNTTTRDDITNEVIRLISDQDDYPVVSTHGYAIQKITNDNIVKYDTMERGGKFYIANIMFNVVAYYEGFASTNNPSATPTFTFNNWMFAPTSAHRIEDWDRGNIVVGNTYNASNGFDYTSSTVAKVSGTTGILLNRTLTVPSNDDDAGLITTFNWTSQADSSTRQTNVTNNFNRIKSVRYGSITSTNAPVFTDDTQSSTGLREIDEWNDGARRVLDFGNASPVGDTINITSNSGEWIYIIYDAAIDDLSGITEDVFSQNIVSDVFQSPVTVGGYKIYIARRATAYTNTYRYTIS